MYKAQVVHQTVMEINLLYCQHYKSTLRGCKPFSINPLRRHERNNDITYTLQCALCYRCRWTRSTPQYHTSVWIRMYWDQNIAKRKAVQVKDIRLPQQPACGCKSVKTYQWRSWWSSFSKYVASHSVKHDTISTVEGNQDETKKKIRTRTF